MIDIKRQEEAFKKLNKLKEERKISEITHNLNNRRKPVTKENRESGIIPYYGATGIIDYVEDYLFNEEIILLAEDGENILSRNAELVYYVTGKSWVNNHAHVLTMKQGNNYYLKYLLSTLNYVKYNSGTAQPKINQETLNNIVVNIDSKNYQEKIAEFLSSLDELIQKQEEYIEELKVQKQGYYKKVFNSTYVKKNRKIPLINLVEIDSPTNKSKYIEEEGQNIIVDMGGISIDSENIAKKRTNLNEDLLDLGDIVMIKDDMANGEFLGQNIIIKKRNKYICGDHVYRIIKKSGIDMNFLHYYFIYLQKENYFIKHANGSAQKSLIKEVLIKIKVPEVDYLVQKKIGVTLEELENILKLQEMKLEQLRQKKKYYLNKIFS